jgi:hypothetical protein
MPRPYREQRTSTSSKPTLEMVQLPIFRVHFRRLEEYLRQVYRMDGFNFLVASGAAAGMVPEYNVGPDLPAALTAADRAHSIRAGRRTRDVQLILTVLCHDGYIPAGRYIIDTRPETPPIEQYRALLQETGTPDSPECAAFRQMHRRDKAFTRYAAEIDNQVHEVLRQRRIS